MDKDQIRFALDTLILCLGTEGIKQAEIMSIDCTEKPLNINVFSWKFDELIKVFGAEDSVKTKEVGDVVVRSFPYGAAEFRTYANKEDK